MSDYGDYLKELLAPLEQERERLLARREEHERHLDGINGEIKRVEAVLKAGGLIEAPPKKKARAVPGVRRLDELETYLRANFANGDGITANTLKDKDFSDHLIYRGLAALQERGAIRLDHMDGMQKVYKLVTA